MTVAPARETDTPPTIGRRDLEIESVEAIASSIPATHPMRFGLGTVDESFLQVHPVVAGPCHV